MRIFTTLIFCAFVFFNVSAQKSKPQKYQSLFWEITSNGLKKPSYLFGTMHVSNKMAFHLSDSFYNAIQHCDMVALELNPQFWQPDMVKLDAAQQQLNDFYKDDASDYLTESSFQINYYYDRLKAALAADPQQINSLLYRTFSVQQDFEEDTYLDLYIYQTGRKFGKLAGGVEDYYQTQKILFEAYAAMAKDKSKKAAGATSQPDYDIDKKIQEAYRRGDLDMLDSLEKISFNSPSYLQKFLYDRDRIQANSIDTILKHHTVFVGVGAAHLPGNNGVIELLRRKGYKLRPIYMQDRNANAKDSVEKLKVAVTFRNVSTDDGMLSLQAPGPLYKIKSNAENENDCWQYADMENGAFYMVNRVKTHAGLLNQNTTLVLQKVDSLLYENIPGKIISKKQITINGYNGFDVTNRTRHGDLQRYNIIVTPYDIWVIKMSGTNDYVSGSEANIYFNSISIKLQQQNPVNFTTNEAGFHVQFAQYPNIHKNIFDNDKVDKFEFESTDSATGNTYAVWKKTISNFSFIEQDSFDLSLMEQSLKESDVIDKEVSRSFTNKEGYNALQMQFVCKNGTYINAEAILQGSVYYLLLEKTSKKNNSNTSFFNSFGFSKIIYQTPLLFKDTLYGFSVKTPVAPKLDTSLTSLMYSMFHDETLLAQMQGKNYWPQTEYATFKSDSTNENILLSLYEFPKYYFAKDSATFWKKQLNLEDEHDAVLYEAKPFKSCDSCEGYKVIWRDTNTVRQIINYKILKGNKFFNLYAIDDSLQKESSFLHDFFTTFTPLNNASESVYKDKTDAFFADLYSTDSLTKAQARNAISHIYFNANKIEKITSFINNLSYGEQDYFEMKSKFIIELGYINDSCCTDKVVNALTSIYKKTADTAYFQNEVLWALANLETKNAYDTLKKLLLQDPPLFDDEGSYADFINAMQDSLLLAKKLFPDLLQLTSIPEYKEPVLDLLKTLLDSNEITSEDYATYFSKIYFDAKIEMKKQQNIEEKLLEQQSQQVFNQDKPDNDNNYNNNDYNINDIYLYASLLLPFYDINEALPKFYNKLLQSRDTTLQIKTAAMLIQNHKHVADSVLINIASKDNYRAVLLKELENINRTDLFPTAYKKQELIAKSLLINNAKNKDVAEVKQEGRAVSNAVGKKGFVYFFLYKTKNSDDDWKIGISGLQPENNKQISSNDLLTSATNKKISNDKSLLEQFNNELLRLQLKLHKSAARFFEDNESYYNRYYNY